MGIEGRQTPMSLSEIKRVVDLERRIRGQEVEEDPRLTAKLGLPEGTKFLHEKGQVKGIFTSDGSLDYGEVFGRLTRGELVITKPKP